MLCRRSPGGDYPDISCCADWSTGSIGFYILAAIAILVFGKFVSQAEALEMDSDVSVSEEQMPGKLDTAAGAADMLRPTIGIGIVEEYNDNVFLTPDETVEDFVTRVALFFLWTRTKPRWHFDLSYTPEYIDYARNTDVNEVRHTATLEAGAMLVRNFAFLDVSNTYRRMSLDTRTSGTEVSTFLGQTDSNRLVVYPYIRKNLTSTTDFELGYEYTKTEYEDPEAVDRESHGLSIIIGKVFSNRINADVSYGFRREMTDRNRPRDYDRHDAYLSLNYQLSSSIRLVGTGGIARIDFHETPIDGAVTEYNSHWEVEVSVRFSTATICSYRYRQSFENSVTNGVFKTNRHSIELNYERDSRFSLEFFVVEDEYLEIIREDKSWGVAAALDVPLHRRLDFHAAGRWRSSEFIDPAAFNLEGVGEDLNRILADTWLRWRSTRHLSLEAGYRYSMDDSTRSRNDFVNNIVYLGARAIY